MVSQEDTVGNSGTSCCGVARALAGTPERFNRGSMATVIGGDSVCGFNVIPHVLMNTGVKA